MEILELILKSYGKFSSHRMVLKPGINIIYGGNETGKTTIHSFIRSMFFGLGRGRGKAAKKDEYQVRQPWDSPGAFLGSMRIMEDGEVYRIDRCFDRSAPPLQVVCETRSEESANPEQDLQELLGGISENAFVNTVFIPQARCETDESFAEELRRYMVNSDSTLDAQLDVTQALQSLRKKKKQFEQKKKKEEEQLEERIARKQEQAELIRADLERLRQQADFLMDRERTGAEFGHEKKRWDASGNRSAEREPEPQYEDWDDEEEAAGTGSGKRILEVLLFIAGMLALIGAFVWQDLMVRICFGGFGVLFLALVFAVHFLLPDGHETDEDMDSGLTEQEEHHLQYLVEEIRNREETYQKLQDELEALYHSHVRLDGADTEIAAITMAIDRICELTAGIYRQTGGMLNEHASVILKEITNGRYDRIVLDETAEVRIHTPSRVLGLHQVSGGTMQQIYFALRMAAGELLSEGRSLPVVLDETFAMYDDARLEAALRWLKKSGRQVVLFTCQNREREILKKIGQE